VTNQLRTAAATVHLHHQASMAIIRIPGAGIPALVGVIRPVGAGVAGTGGANFLKESIPLQNQRRLLAAAGGDKRLPRSLASRFNPDARQGGASSTSRGSNIEKK